MKELNLETMLILAVGVCQFLIILVSSAPASAGCIMSRIVYSQAIKDQFRIHSVCAILGPQQAGKKTLVKMYIEQSGEKVRFFDLENPLDLAQLENPMLTLSPISDQLIVIYAIQRRPELFPVLRVLVDEEDQKRRFLILGDASRDFIRQSSETLAGRIGYIELPPFSLPEVKNSKQLWLRGGFPLSYLAANDHDSYVWRQDYIATVLERDVPNLGFYLSAQQLRRFWVALTDYHGQVFNASKIGRVLGISDHTARTYLDLLAGTFMVRILYPWLEDLEKRQVKSPKIYFRDSGMLHALLGVTTLEQLGAHPKGAASWKGFALEEVTRFFQLRTEECFFWATQAGAELDLFTFHKGKRLGFIFQYVDSPKITKSMRIALEDLKLDHLMVVYPGKVIFPLSETITACGLESLATGECKGL